MRVSGASGRLERPAIIILGLVAALVLFLGGMYLRASARQNHVALAQRPKPVSTRRATSATYRPSRTYVGTLEPWETARVGPQYVSAYVSAVLVRPGAAVQRGQVLGTLDCRNYSAASQGIAARERALDERRLAYEHEAERLKELSQGGFASANELEQRSARARAEAAEAEGLKAELLSKSLAVDDCVLRAPFAGEVSQRLVDPGAYLRPGQAAIVVVDRSRVRITAEAPESDFNHLTPGTPVRIEGVATGAKMNAVISRRAPAADDATRTIHIEMDVENPKRDLPVGTTATVTLDAGDEQPALAVPLRSASVRGEEATLFLVEGERAHKRAVAVLGEIGGTLYVAPRFAAGASVVVEGRALLNDGDLVQAQELAP
ncbi:MAG TPA: efflux RND transporter periplasmic adaptor subunit [Polyangia bacterium]|jgi:RND family efflux transporter MFP subunit|nr:efflux RND transporter periplasmic adaptor subunit [Polyangia bacterium]